LFREGSWKCDEEKSPGTGAGLFSEKRVHIACLLIKGRVLKKKKTNKKKKKKTKNKKEAKTKTKKKKRHLSHHSEKG